MFKCQPFYLPKDRSLTIASESVIEFTDANFDAEVIAADLPVLVDFWAEWCMPCKMLGPIIDELAGDFDGKVKVGKLDTDSNRDVAVKYSISAIPTIMLFNKGELVKQFRGVTPKTELAEALETLSS